LAHESKFVQSIPLDTVSAEQLITQVDDYFERDNTAAAEEVRVN
jgi:hypothetical protein